MPIPEFTEQGVLPEGFHDTNLEQIEDRLGRFNGSDLRVELFRRFRLFMQEVRFWGNVEEIMIDGSFVTNKQRPSDVDIILVYRADFDLASEVRPQEYNLISRKRAKRIYGFDVIAVTAHSPEREKWLGYFSNDTRTGLQNKGLLRLRP
jgi:hypothetical protein